MKTRLVLLTALCLAISFSVWANTVQAATNPSKGDSIIALNAAADNQPASKAAVTKAPTGPSALADPETVITLGGTVVVSGTGVVVTDTTVTITAGGTFRALGTLADGMLDVNTAETVELILDGVTITHSTGPAINVTDAEKLSLVLAAGTSNTLVDGETCADSDQKATLFSNDTLEISGDGDLAITGNYKHAVASDDDLIITSGNITISSTVKDAFHANDHITVSGGRFKPPISGVIASKVKAPSR